MNDNLACPGIYAIKHISSGRQYIGSAKNIAVRWWQHRHALGKGRHHSRYLQRSWNLHGEDAFSFVVLEYVDDADKLLIREQHYFEQRRAETGNDGYNMYSAARGPLGMERSESTRAKLRAAWVIRGGPTQAHRAYWERKTGKPASPRLQAHLVELNTSRRGKHMSATAKMKLSASLKEAWNRRRLKPKSEKQIAMYARLSQERSGKNWPEARRMAQDAKMGRATLTDQAMLSAIQALPGQPQFTNSWQFARILSEHVSNYPVRALYSRIRQLRAAGLLDEYFHAGVTS